MSTPTWPPFRRIAQSVAQCWWSRALGLSSAKTRSAASRDRVAFTVETRIEGVVVPVFGFLDARGE
jgi:hypothetical protein